MDRSVVINARFSSRPMTGVERFATEITRRLDADVRLEAPASGAQGALGHLWEQFLLPRRVGEYDVLWSPANSGPIRVPNQVVTIHDLSPIEHPEWFHPTFGTWYRYLLPHLARNSEKITTDSQFSKDRIIELFGLPEAKVSVVYGAVNQDFFRPASREDCDATRVRFSLPNQYIFSIGTLEPRKNLTSLLKSWDLAGLASQGFELIIAGASENSIHKFDISIQDVPGVRFLGYVPDIYLPSLYTDATMFVFPSLYEGFGLPVLEAMACAAPVISSNAAALPEVAGDAAALFNPRDPEELADRIREIALSPKTLDSMQKASVQRAQEFSWDKSAELISDLLSSTG